MTETSGTNHPHRMTRNADPSALKLAVAVTARLRKALGSNLAAIYLHGSAVLGGFDPSMSDLDMLVLCEGPLSHAEVHAVARAVAHLDLPAKGLEMSVLAASEALSPDLENPRFQLHAAVSRGGGVRLIDGRAGGGDRDLVLHLAVCRASGYSLAGPSPGETLKSVPDAVVKRAMIEEIGWARAVGDPVYLVLTVARASAFARSGRLVSKVEAGEAEAALPVVRVALAIHRRDPLPIDLADARRYADEVEARLRTAWLVPDASVTEGRVNR
jgi:Aminoglycoside adenylyltransferase, C-terminal domain